jgi:hypothetical protein
MSSVWSFRDSEAAAKREVQAAELASLRARGFTIYEWDDLREVGDGWLADADDRLWRAQRGEPVVEGFRPGQHAVGLGPGRGYLRTPERDEPPSLAELEKRQAAAEAAQAESQRKAQADFEARQAEAPPVTATRLAGRRALTLRDAGEVVARAAGRLEVRGGRLVVSLPMDATSSTLAAAGLLYDAEAVVADAVKAKRELPDAEVTPAGALLPS